MIITLSPAKLQDFDSEIKSDLKSDLLYPKEADYLIDLLKDYKSEEIAKLMTISPKQATDVFQKIQGYHLSRTPQRQAIFAYNGIAYLGLDAKTFDKDDLQFAQEHLTIVTGLYGALRPLDMIKPYRLEMKIKLANDKGNDLYKFWKEEINNYFGKRLQSDDNIWVNLSSDEYSKVIDLKLLPKGVRKITPLFKEEQADGSFKQIVVYAKKARGMMSRYIIKNKLTNVEDIKGFGEEGYLFNPHLSDDKEWIFTR